MPKLRQVQLTSLTQNDLPFLLDWINDRQQVIFSAPFKPVSQRSHQEWFEAIQRREDTVIFGIRLAETGQFIGSCQLRSISSVHRNAELQIRLGEVEQRGKGYGTDAVRLLLNFAFKDLNLHRVYLHVFSSNAAAIRVYGKVGFVREGTLRQAAYIDGKYLDTLIMGILREDYAAE